jgi:flagellar basal body P-ring protein FlgI
MVVCLAGGVMLQRFLEGADERLYGLPNNAIHVSGFSGEVREIECSVLSRCSVQLWPTSNPAFS